MPQAFSAYSTIKGLKPLLRYMACEVRYEDGQLYLDRCGRILKQLVGSAPEWIVSPTPTPQGTTVFNLRTGVQLGFSIEVASLTLNKTAADEVIEPDEAAGFLEEVASTLVRVVDELEPTKFSRIGYREHYYFAFERKEETEEWLRNLGLFAVSSSLYEAFNGSHEASAVAVILEGAACRYRIALTGIERSAQIPVGDTMLGVRASAVSENQKKVLTEALKKQKQRQINSAFAAVFDVDAYLTNPPEFDVVAFAKERAETNLRLFRAALPGESPKKKGK